MTTYLTDSDGKINKLIFTWIKLKFIPIGKFIPATQRPDGTWRKARRVKEGYVPQEEVPLYESKGKQFAQRKTNLPVGMCPLVAAAAKKEREKQERAKVKKQQPHPQQQRPVPGVLVLPNTSSSKTASNAKPAKATNTTNASSNNTTTTVVAAPAAAAAAVMPENVDLISKDLGNMELEDDKLEFGKKLKKLKKKIREIESIEAKIKSGELKKPEKDQLDKVKRKKEILKEIQQLEAEELVEQQLQNGSA